jgi:TPR repeat protein
MKTRVVVFFLAAAMLGPAQAQTSKQPAKPAPKNPAPASTAPVQAAPDGDVAFGAYQRGLYLTALIEAQKRMEQNNDPKAMTLLGELYANGLGVGMNDAKAAELYKRAADRGDREAMLQLGMMRFS